MTLTFEPLFSLLVILPLIGLGLLLAAFGLYRRQRGMTLRSLALAIAALALANPLIVDEDRSALSTIVAIVADRSQSQDNDGRKAQTDEAIKALQTAFKPYKDIELRIIEAGRDAVSDRPSTRVFPALSAGLEDVPPSRVGGVVIVTDGQVHDVPEDGRPAGIDAPVHTLLTGKANEFDRRIEIVKAPRFGLVGKDQDLVFKVIDDGTVPAGTANVTIRLDGEIVGNLQAAPGREITVAIAPPKAGENVVEIGVETVEGEVTAINNRIIHLIEGIRENLRVLLVSGEPHAGERAWRNLLKSDASVDLVHFTILRPPEKQDGTPINELSLIAFPTRELFVDKINDFDLIIFDRYQHRGVLPILYYDNIAQYVRAGGALLLVTGPEHAGTDSIAMTPLSGVLPATPTGTMLTGPFYPRLSELGQKHPVSRGLNGSTSEPPRWGRWFRSVNVTVDAGSALMTAADGNPLLVLNRVDEGRVAMLLSDQGWLWARGFEGGGPHVDLYRRISHWLMKEPALEEEALTARAIGRQIEVSRQTIGKDVPAVSVTSPSSVTTQLTLSEVSPGLWRSRFDATDTGLYQLRQGDLTALVHSGAIDAPEYRQTVSTPDLMAKVAEATGGMIQRLSEDSGALELPQILAQRSAIRTTDDSRLTIRLTGDTVLKGISTIPAMAGLFGLALMLMAISATWWREGR